MSAINIKLADLKVRMEYHSHVAIEYYRGDKWSEFVFFEPNGPRKGKLLTSSFEKEYYRSSEIPVDRAALSFLRAQHRAYIPETGLSEIIMEIYIMAMTEAHPKGIQAMSTEQLLKMHNELAEALGKPQLKSFKQSKMLLVTRIAALRDEFAALTPAQETAAATNAAKAEKRLAGLKDLTTSKENDMATTKKAAPSKKPVPKATAKKPAAKPAPKATAKKADTGAPKKQGIGAFCMDLIRNGKDNDAVLAAVQKKFPDASTSLASIAWYRNKLKNEG